MLKRMILTVVAVLAFSNLACANDQLVQELKHMGQAVDNMSVHISTAATDADAALMAQATQQAFAANMQGNPKPEVSITASAGRCDVTISTPQWQLWSRAEKGAIVDHGAKIH
jgi:hypothetical protein